MHKNNASTSALAIVFVAFAVVFIAGLAVVIPAFEEAQAVISIGDQVQMLMIYLLLNSPLT
jgi:hypothetical protein